ncbi:MAG TPA: hypothetical protein VNB24_02980 [Acidimicrobiales bacterium]|nr:hypothetical protein [Acidimicrobiales bacterium]
MSDVDPRVAAAVEHLQRAALELIAAARNALDVAEDLARDPVPLQAMVETVLTTFAPGRAAEPPDTDDGSGSAPRIQRIRVD